MGAEIVICTSPWSEDAPAEEGERPNAQLGFRAFVDGKEVKAVAYQVNGSGGDFQTIDLQLAVSSIEFRQITLDELRDPDFEL